MKEAPVQQVLAHEPQNHPPEPPVLGIPSYFWLGFILPIVIAFIIHRKNRKGE